MKRQQPAGVLLLLALVMMALVLSASLVLATVIIREIRLAQISDKGITAFYAAETAAEDAVFHLFKLGEDPSVLDASGSLSGGASWTRVSKRTDVSFVHDFVSRDETVVVNLYNTANVNEAAGVESLSIEWTSGQSVDVLINEWDGTALGSPSAPTICVASPCVINTPLFNKAYRVALTVRGAAMTDLMVFVFAGDGGAGAPVAVEIPVTVVANGQFQGARQAVELRVPSPEPWEGGSVPPPPPASCGNGAIESGENCDDSNTANGDGCSSVCILETPPASCGNASIEGSEVCDDGNTTNAGICNGSCTALTLCGDATIQNPNGQGVSEQCDDNNTNNGDGCSATCQIEMCPLLVSTFGSAGSANGQFDTPSAIAVDPLGDLYVADRNNNRVQVFSQDGTFLRTWGSSGSGNGQFNQPNDVAIPRSGSVWTALAIVVDTMNHRVQFFDRNTGVYQTTYGSFGSTNGRLNTPYGAGMTSTSLLVIADTGNNRIHRWPTVGGFWSSFGTAGAGNGQFNGPKYIAIDSGNNIYVTDNGNNRVQKFDVSGAYLLQFPVAVTMNDIQVDANDNVWISTATDIRQYSNIGTLIDTWATESAATSVVSPSLGTFFATRENEVRELFCSDIALATCGNNALDGSEVCDDGDTTNAGTCNATCTALTSCGDGTTQPTNGQGGTEQCDDGNTANGDDCSSTCQLPTCITRSIASEQQQIDPAAPGFQSQAECSTRYGANWPFPGCYEYMMLRNFPVVGGVSYNQSATIVQPVLSSCVNNAGNDCSMYFRTPSTAYANGAYLWAIPGNTQYGVYYNGLYGRADATGPTVTFTQGSIQFCK